MAGLKFTVCSWWKSLLLVLIENEGSCFCFSVSQRPVLFRLLGWNGALILCQGFKKECGCFNVKNCGDLSFRLRNKFCIMHRLHWGICEVSFGVVRLKNPMMVM